MPDEYSLHVVVYLAQEIVGGILKMFNALNIVGDRCNNIL